MGNTNAQTNAGNRAVKCISVIGTAFLLGLVPMWLLAHSRGVQRNAVIAQSALLRIQNEIASAALHAERGEYEAARQRASRFYTHVAELLDHDAQLTDSQRDVLKPLLASRDEVITLLARNDSAVLAHLFDLEYKIEKNLQT